MDTTNTGKLDHVALYVGDQTILQHCVKRLSSRETYDQKWIECTKKRYHMLSKIKVYGRLARFLGQRSFEAEINSTIDAIRFFSSKFS